MILPTLHDVIEPQPDFFFTPDAAHPVKLCNVFVTFADDSGSLARHQRCGVRHRSDEESWLLLADFCLN